MLVTSIFFFSDNVFYPSLKKFQFFSHIYFVATALNLDKSTNLLFDTELKSVVEKGT